MPVGHCLNRHVALLNDLHGLAVQSIRDHLSGLQIAVLCFLDDFVGNDPQATATAAQQRYLKRISERVFPCSLTIILFEPFERDQCE